MNELQFSLGNILDAFDEVFGVGDPASSLNVLKLRRKFLKELGEGFALEETETRVTEGAEFTCINYVIVDLDSGLPVAFCQDYTVAVVVLEALRSNE